MITIKSMLNVIHRIHVSALNRLKICMISLNTLLRSKFILILPRKSMSVEWLKLRTIRNKFTKVFVSFVFGFCRILPTTCDWIRKCWSWICKQIVVILILINGPILRCTLNGIRVLFVLTNGHWSATFRGQLKQKKTNTRSVSKLKFYFDFAIFHFIALHLNDNEKN